MVPKRMLGIVIHPKAVSHMIIGTGNGLSVPDPATLDPKMVISFTRQITISVARFQQRLRQFYAGGDTILIHLRDGDILISLDIVPPGGGCRSHGTRLSGIFLPIGWRLQCCFSRRTRS